MPGFLERFFPSLVHSSDSGGEPKTVLAAATSAVADPGVILKQQGGHAGDGGGSDPYCTFDNQVLQWFTSSLFIAGVFAALPAGYTTRCEPVLCMPMAV